MSWLRWTRSLLGPASGLPVAACRDAGGAPVGTFGEGVMATGIKAIETRYKGYRFRSRLEARWAVFFDALGIVWEYEKEGFDLGAAGYYLPDFWLPDLNVWIEIKGEHPTPEEEAKAWGLATATDRAVVMFTCGIPMPWSLEEIQYLCGSCDSGRAHFSGGGWDNLYQFCERMCCGKIGIEFDGRSARITCDCKPGYDGKAYTVGSPRLKAAYTAARSARFEFGESGSK
mgnify:CR=1 FL=1